MEESSLLKVSCGGAGAVREEAATQRTALPCALSRATRRAGLAHWHSTTYQNVLRTSGLNLIRSTCFISIHLAASSVVLNSTNAKPREAPIQTKYTHIHS